MVMKAMRRPMLQPRQNCSAPGRAHGRAAWRAQRGAKGGGALHGAPRALTATSSSERATPSLIDGAEVARELRRRQLAAGHKAGHDLGHLGVDVLDLGIGRGQRARP
jgi:hypothetical protein